MKKTFKTLTIMTVVCLLTATVHAATHVKPWSHGRLMVSANHRYLQFENGQPFFLL